MANLKFHTQKSCFQEQEWSQNSVELDASILKYTNRLRKSSLENPPASEQVKLNHFSFGFGFGFDFFFFTCFDLQRSSWIWKVLGSKLSLGCWTWTASRLSPGFTTTTSNRSRISLPELAESRPRMILLFLLAADLVLTSDSIFQVTRRRQTRKPSLRLDLKSLKLCSGF